MFSGDMLLNPQIFGRAPQPPKRNKSKRTHIIHQKTTTTTINAKIASSSNGSSQNKQFMHKSNHHSHQKYGNIPIKRKNFTNNNNIYHHSNPSKKLLGNSNHNNINDTHSINNINHVNMDKEKITMDINNNNNNNHNNKQSLNEFIDHKMDIDNNKTKIHNKSLETTPQKYKLKMNFIDNKDDKIPLPGVETKEELKKMILNDEYYAAVVCNGQLPKKQICIGLLYFLLIIAIDSYLEMWPISIIIATFLMIILFCYTN